MWKKKTPKTDLSLKKKEAIYKKIALKLKSSAKEIKTRENEHKSLECASEHTRYEKANKQKKK